MLLTIKYIGEGVTFFFSKVYGITKGFNLNGDDIIFKMNITYIVATDTSLNLNFWSVGQVPEFQGGWPLAFKTFINLSFIFGK